MSGNRLLADTNILLYLLAGDETVAELLNEKQIYISFITELELLGYRGISTKESKQVQNLLSGCTIVNINNQIKSETIRLKRSKRMKLPDSIIAATAKYLDVPVLTADADFENIDDLDVILYELP